MGSMAIYLSGTILFFFFNSKLFINHRKRKMEPWCWAAGVQTQTSNTCTAAELSTMRPDRPLTSRAKSFHQASPDPYSHTYTRW